MTKYLLCEKGIEINYKKDVMTIKEIFEFFVPNDDLQKEMEAWKKSYSEGTIDSLRTYIEKYVNNNDGIHCHDYTVEEW